MLPRRPLVLLACAGLLLAACGSGEQERPLPDVDPPSVATAAPVQAGVVEAGWLEESSSSTGIPARVLQAYAAAEATIAESDPACELSWNTLAGIGRLESIHGAVNGSSIGADGKASPDIVGIALDGTNGTRAVVDTDDGRLDGDTEWDRAVGPMQFIPETWATWGADGDGDGVRDPQDVDDAALAAGRYLCGSGGELDGTRAWITAVLTYNNSAEYARRVSGAATEYADRT